jgi:hypothetical protein
MTWVGDVLLIALSRDESKGFSKEEMCQVQDHPPPWGGEGDLF